MRLTKYLKSKILSAAVFMLLGHVAFCSASIYSIQPGKGIVTLEHNVAMFMRYQGQDGKLVSQKSKRFNVRLEHKSCSMHGSGTWILVPDQPPANVEISAAINKANQSGKFTYAVTTLQSMKSLRLDLQMTLPVNLFAGREIILNQTSTVTFPENFRNYQIKSVPEVKQFTLPLSNGDITFTLSHPCTVDIADNRKNHADHFKINISMIPKRSKLTSAELEVSTEYSPYQTIPLSLNEAANSTFSDANPNDQKGGWTDQGANQDLRSICSQKVVRSGFAVFDILSAAKNKGRECIVLGGKYRNYFPRRAEQHLPAPAVMKTLLLLHASAWTSSGEIGYIEVTFTDGSICKIPVRGNSDVADWWNPSSQKNCLVIYKHRCDESDSGLYLSAFPVPDKPVRKLAFVTTGPSVWMIAAASMSPQSIKLPAPGESLFQRDKHWRQIIPAHNIKTGSPLDFSFMLDAPAGKYGRVIVKNGSFSFANAPGKRIRFYGTNLCTMACVVSHEKAKQLVEWLSKTGYNAIRLHQFDREVVKRNHNSSSLIFDDKKIDNLDYLIYLLKQRGFYIFLDLYSLRDRVPGEFPNAPNLKNLKDFKLAIMTMPEVRENLKKYIRRIFGHVNPYTGISLAKDPVLAAICIINENMIISLYDDCGKLGRKGGISYRHCNELFRKYCQKKNIKVDKNNHRALLNQFLYKLYNEYYEDMKSFLHGEMKMTALLTDQNHRQPPLAAELRNNYDYVDNHIYWDHPAYIGKVKWCPPYQIRNESLTQSNFWPICALGPSRLVGKPFTVTEFNVCYPNKFRADSGLIFGAFAAFQNWDGLFRFDYAHKYAMFGSPYPTDFSTLNDPVRGLSDKIGALLFIRGDLKPADEILPLVVNPKRFNDAYVESYPQDMQKLTLHVRTGTILSGQPLPVSSLPPWILGQPAPASVTRAMKRQPAGIRYNRKDNTFSLTTKRNESCCLPQGKIYTGNHVTVKAKQGFSVVSVIAMDRKEKAISETSRILVFFLTDIRQEGLIFGSTDGLILKVPPRSNAILARNGKAEVQLNIAPGKWNAVALDNSGQALGKVPLNRKNHKTILSIDNFLFPGKVIFAYELIKQ